MAIFPVTETVTTKTTTRTSGAGQDIAEAAVVALLSGIVVGAVGWVLYKIETSPAFEWSDKPEHQWGAEDLE